MLCVSTALAAASSSAGETASVPQGQLIAVGAGSGGAGAACFSCHGLQGQGDAGAAFPRLALLALACLSLADCDLFETASYKDKVVVNGDPALGRALIASGVHGCTTCHAIPGMRGLTWPSKP